MEGIFLLSGDSISPTDLLQSEKLLRYFVFMFKNLYEERFLTLNCHSLLHLPNVESVCSRRENVGVLVA